MLDQRMVVLDTAVLLPPAGQGALGLEFRRADDQVRRLLAPLDHPPTRWAVTAERALVRRLGAGCRTPLGILGRVDGAGQLALDAWILSEDGREAIRRQAAGPADDADRIGTALGETLLAAGAARLLGSAVPPLDAAQDGAHDA
jgi:hydroxymethylbilane synthase